MRLRDLIDELTEIAETHGDHVEVRLAHQPRWPFEYAISDVAVVDGADDDEDDDEDEDAGGDERERGEGEPAVVYIGEGDQIGYLPGAASRALGWRRR